MLVVFTSTFEASCIGSHDDPERELSIDSSVAVVSTVDITPVTSLNVFFGVLGTVGGGEERIIFIPKIPIPTQIRRRRVRHTHAPDCVFIK